MNYDTYDCRIRIAAPSAAKKLKKARRGKKPGPRTVGRLAGLLRPVVGAAALLACAAGAGAQIIIQPTTEALSKDSKIYDTLPTMSLSSNLNIVSQDVGAHFVSLVQFDLSTVTYSAADITSATLTLYCTGLGSSGGPAVGGLVSVSPILNEWRETSSDPGTAPLSTYAAFFGASPTLTFGSAVDTETVSGVGFYTWDLTPLVKDWVSGARQNNGVLIQLVSSGGDIGLASAASNPAVAGSSPSLTVVPEPGSAILLIGGLVPLMGRRRRNTAAR